MQTFLVLQRNEVEQFFSSYLLDILHGVLLKKKRCVVKPNSVCIRSRGEIIFFCTNDIHGDITWLSNGNELQDN